MKLGAGCWSLLEVGERTGKLGESMSGVGELIRERSNRRKEFIGQLWYPGFVFLTGIAVLSLILVWVIPKMHELAETMGMDGNLPWLTEHIGTLYGALLLAVLFATFAAVGLAYLWRVAARRYSLPGRAREYLLGRFPVVGQIWRTRREADIQVQMANLLRGGITLPHLLEILSGLTMDQWEKGQFLDFRKRLLMGSGFEDSLKRFTPFSEDNHTILVSGQECGQLDEFLLRLSREGEKLVLRRLDQLIRLVEPLMLIGLSGAIGGLVLAYLLPMIRMFEQLSL
jgi:type II secretory pathway component PulF